jgi:hypothetical protein
MVIRPEAVSAKSTSAWAIMIAWPSLSARRRSQRSAAAPAKGPTTTVGKRSAKAMAPSQAPDSVSCQVSQPTATRCIQVPISETALPAT